MTGTPTAPAVDTDRVLLEFPDGKGARLLITESGALGIDVGGHVVVRPVEVWHALALSAQSPPGTPTAPSFDDPRVQLVYSMLCDDDSYATEGDEHWEGAIDRKSVV